MVAVTDAAQQITDLQAQVARLEGELATVRAKNKSQIHHGLTLHPFRFLDLARELRNAIYDLCLVPGKVYIQPPGRFKTHDMRVGSASRAETQVFLVCKQIQHEAQEVYYGKNVFLLLAAPSLDLVDKPPDPDSLLFPNSLASKYIRRVSLTLDYRQAANFATDIVVQTQRPRELAQDSEVDQSICHDRSKHGLVDFIWRGILDAVNAFRCPALAELQINLQNCYCDNGCHRTVKETFNTAAYSSDGSPLAGGSVFGGLRNKAHKRIDFLGTVSEEERRFIAAHIKRHVTEVRFFGLLKRYVYGDGSFIRAEWDADT